MVSSYGYFFLSHYSPLTIHYPVKSTSEKMIIPKGKLIIIGGAVDMGTNLGSGEGIIKPNYLKFFEQGILKRIVTESAKQHDSVVEIITTASQIPELVGEE